MKTKKRILSLLTAMVLLLCIPIAAHAEGTELRIIGPTEAPAVGESFTVTVELSGNPGIVGVRLALAYDKEKLSCDEIEDGDAISGMMSVNNTKASSGAMFAAASAEESTTDGVIASFRFTVKDAGAEVPRELVIVELNVLGGERLQDTIVQMDEQGQILPSPEKPDTTDPGNTDEPDPGNTENPDPGKTENPDPGKTENPDPGNTENPTPVNPDTPVSDDPGNTDETDPSAGGEPEAAKPPFTDVVNHWGAAYIAKAASMDPPLFDGFPDGSFRPNDKVTRGQFVTVLWRMAGKPAPDAPAAFEDVPAAAYYADAVAWAYAKGYVNGRSETTFDPAGQITRQEAMKILFAYAGGVSGMELLFTETYDKGFTDSGDIASWAKPAMYWGYYKGILNGKSATTLAPKDSATRAELAKILVVYSEKQ